MLIPSPKVATYDLQPEMSAYPVTEEACRRIASGEYALVVLNYANPDTVGHTGKFEAAVRACEVVDECVGRIWEATREARRGHAPVRGSRQCRCYGGRPRATLIQPTPPTPFL